MAHDKRRAPLSLGVASCCPGYPTHIDQHEIVVDGVPTRWHEVGEGCPVVMVHGIPTSPALWRHVAPLLVGRAMAWEMTGYGSSIPFGDGRDISVAAQADHLVRWLDALGIERAVLAGHDLGGGVVQIAAVRAPKRCTGLLLTNAISYDSWPIPSVKAMGAMGPLVARLPDAVFRLALLSFFRRGHDSSSLAKDALDAHWPHYAANGGAVAMVRQIRALDVHDTIGIQDRLPAIDVPARVVWGTGDQFQKVAYGKRLAHDLRTDLRRIEGAKHWTPEDHPHAIADAINELVAIADET